MMACSVRELTFLVIQYLKEESMNDSLHSLEQESAIFFNLEYFKERLLNKKWEDALNYLTSFNVLGDLFVMIQRLKYYDALEEEDRYTAFKILANELKLNPSLLLLLWGDLRDCASDRAEVLGRIEELIVADPVICDKQTFPIITDSRLMTLITQSLKWKQLQPNVAQAACPITNLSKSDVLCLIMQFLKEEKLEKTLHMLEQESAIHINTRYIKELSTDGRWDEVLKYTHAFASNDKQVEKNLYELIQSQMYIEALYKRDLNKALHILDDLKDVADEKTFKNLVTMSTENFSGTATPTWAYIKSSRVERFNLIKVCLQKDWSLCNKLIVPPMMGLSLRKIIDESLKWQHQQCENPKMNPDYQTLFVNHSCGPSQLSGAQPTSPITNHSGDDGAAPVSVDLMPSSSGFTPTPSVLTSASTSVSKIRSMTTFSVSEPSQLECISLRVHGGGKSTKVTRLVYDNLGDTLFALASIGDRNKLCKWTKEDVMANASLRSQLWQPARGKLMTDDGVRIHPYSCLTMMDTSALVTSGGMISSVNLNTLKTTTFMPPPRPEVTYVAVNPNDSNIIAVGMEDSTIQIFIVPQAKVVTKLEGHLKRITCLAFSSALNLLISCGADSRVCVWNTHGWEMVVSMQLHCGVGTPPFTDTFVVFHQDQKHLLLVHENWVSIFELPKPQSQFLVKVASKKANATNRITNATYSCDGRLVYVIYEDGVIHIRTAPSLTLCRYISPNAYLSSSINHPLVIAAHPSRPNQFAVGLTDGGGVCIMEPLGSGDWPEGGTSN